MQPFTTLDAVAAPLLRDNIDTDAIFPARFIQRLDADYAGALFANWRFDAEGAEIGDFVLNRPAYRGAGILIAGANFGCGSSREHAVWALIACGIRCVIAPSFGDIFRGNAYNNGLLPVVLPAEAVHALGEGIERANDKRLRVDLGAQRIEPPGGGGLGFGIDPARRAALMEGLDEIGLTLRQAEAIAGFQARDREERPWIHAVGDNTKEREETSP